MDDLISRKDAINFRVANALCEDGIIYCRMYEVKNYLKSLPSAQNTGKWSGADGLYGCGIYICDNCGKFAMIKSDFCPNCGADMREGEQDG